MAEAFVCKGGSKLKKGEKLLIVAYWNLLKQTSEESNSSEQTLVGKKEIDQYKAQLHKTFGRLFTAQNRFPDAIKEFAQSIYLECIEYGPESIQLCSSYFYLGDIFRKIQKSEEAKSFFTKIIEIWQKHILNQLHVEQENPEDEDIYYEEAKQHLEQIKDYFEQELGNQDILTADCYRSYALVMLKTNQIDKAVDYLDNAYYVFNSFLGEANPKTREIKDLVDQIKSMDQEYMEGEME